MKVKLVLKGGSGSGNFGHAGRPGEIGGSEPGGGGGNDKPARGAGKAQTMQSQVQAITRLLDREDWMLPYRVEGNSVHVTLAAPTARQFKKDLEELKNSVERHLPDPERYYINTYHEDIEKGQTEIDDIEFEVVESSI